MDTNKNLYASNWTDFTGELLIKHVWVVLVKGLISGPPGQREGPCGTTTVKGTLLGPVRWHTEAERGLAMLAQEAN